METISFTKMDDGTAEEYAFLTPLYNVCLREVPETLLKILKQMQGGGNVIQDRPINSFSSICHKSRKRWRR